MSSYFPLNWIIIGFSLKDAHLSDIFIPQKRNVREDVNELAKRSFFSKYEIYR